MRAALVVLFLATACATEKAASKNVPYSSQGQAKPKGVLRCHVERDTGSNYAERICEYEEAKGQGDTTIDDALIQAQRRAAQHDGPAYDPSVPSPRAGSH
jgi:hypothetical protein